MTQIEKYNLRQDHTGEERIYFLPMRPLVDIESSMLKFVGADAQSERSRPEFELSLKKAESGEYQRVLFPQNILLSEDSLEIVRSTLDRGFLVSIWITPHYFLRLKLKLIQTLLEMGVELEILVVAGEENSLDSVFQRMGERRLSVTFLMTKGLSAEESFQKLGSSKHNFYYYFPTPSEKESQIYSVRQIREQIEQFKKRYGELTIRGRSGLDVYDSRIGEERDLEPVISPSFETSVKDKDIKVSVIVPSYNNCLYLSVVVKHLTQQNLDRRLFEIVLVDDGSDDGTFEYFKDFAQTHADQFNLKLIYFPRHRARQMGDGQFRASVARNLGVKNSLGDIYAFLDSDILVPPNYLTNLIRLHESWDVVQGRRLELLKQKSHSQTEYSQVDSENSTYAVDNGFWVKFLEDPRPWNDIENGWRYACTHSLSVKAEKFKSVGWFRKTFAFYGYEDSELGYRLWQNGASFSLNDQHVYHLYHADSRSEFSNSHIRKLILLSKTAPIFYVNALDEDVYGQLSYLFDDFFRLKSLFVPIVGPIKKVGSGIVRILLACIWFFSFIVRRVITVALSIVVSPWVIFSQYRLKKRFAKDQQKGIRGEVVRELPWQVLNKPLSLVRYYYCERDDELKGDFLQSVMKAANGHFDGIVFSENLIFQDQYEQVLEFAQSKLSLVIVEVSQKKLFDASARLRIEAVASKYTIHLIVDKYEDKIIPEIHRLLSFDETLLVLSLNRWFVIDGFLRALGEEFWSQVYLRANPKVKLSDSMISSDDLYTRLRQVERRCPGFVVQPEPGQPITNQYAWRPNFDDFSSYEIGTSRAPQVKFSVVVHHRQEFKGLETLISHLKSQDISSDLFEIIWVCDGVEEDRAAKELAYFMNYCTTFNFKMLHIPSAGDQVTDEWQSRADLSLWLGASEARGEIISFICSDMVWRKDTISDLLGKHKSYEVIQSQLYLAPRKEAQFSAETWPLGQLKGINQSPLVDSRDYSVDEHELSTAWSMLGSYGFSFKREAYFWVGGVRKEYFGTGVAISELGYRLSEAGAHFYLNSRLFAQFYIGSEARFFMKTKFPLFYGARSFFAETLSCDVHKKFLTSTSLYRSSSKKSVLREIVELPLKWLGLIASVILSVPDDLITSWMLAPMKSFTLKKYWLDKVYYKLCNPSYYYVRYFPGRVKIVFSKAFYPFIYFIRYFPGKVWALIHPITFPVLYFVRYIPVRTRTVFVSGFISVQWAILKIFYFIPKEILKKTWWKLYSVGSKLYSVGCKIWWVVYSAVNKVFHKIFYQVFYQVYGLLVKILVISISRIQIIFFYIRREAVHLIFGTRRGVVAIYWGFFSVIHPIRKGYYFARFQVTKRLNRKHESKQVAGHE